MFKQLEKRIIAKMQAIKTKKETPAESGIGKLINLMKNIDEPCYENLMSEYKAVLNTI